MTYTKDNIIGIAFTYHGTLWGITNVVNGLTSHRKEPDGRIHHMDVEEMLKHLNDGTYKVMEEAPYEIY